MNNELYEDLKKVNEEDMAPVPVEAIKHMFAQYGFEQKGEDVRAASGVHLEFEKRGSVIKVFVPDKSEEE